MDETSVSRNHRRNSHRSDPVQTATAGREGSVTPAAACPEAASQAAVTTRDWVLLVFLASRVHTWQEALVRVQPETVLRWQRAGFRLLWRRKSAAGSREPQVPRATVALMEQMAQENPLWGAERLRGELLQLDLRVCKRTIQRSTRPLRKARPPGQAGSTFLHQHAPEIWACDFLQVRNLFFRPLFAFFNVELGSRRVVHIGVTRAPSDLWVAHQLREATPFGQGPKVLVRDNDAQFGPNFARIVTGSGIQLLRTPHQAPRATATCERFLGSVRRACLDHIFI
jgi:putative transposase